MVRVGTGSLPWLPARGAAAGRPYALIEPTGRPGRWRAGLRYFDLFDAVSEGCSPTGGGSSPLRAPVVMVLSSGPCWSVPGSWMPRLDTAAALSPDHAGEHVAPASQPKFIVFGVISAAESSLADSLAAAAAADQATDGTARWRHSRRDWQGGPCRR